MMLVLAACVMVAFAAVPRRLRHFQIPAILGWAMVWVDNDLTGQWWDRLGLCLAAASLIGLARHLVSVSTRRVSVNRPKPVGERDHLP